MLNVNEEIRLFREELLYEEKHENTIAVYCRYVRRFLEYIDGVDSLTREDMKRYKVCLQEQNYKTKSVNLMLTAVNRYLIFRGKEDCRIKLVKRQKQTVRADELDLSVEKFLILMRNARAQNKTRLFMIMLTLAGTGIRISELKFVTVESLERGYIEVDNKGKCREVLLSKRICEELDRYAKRAGITSDILFRTKHGNAIDRKNLLREMKNLAVSCGIEERKVFPHNFRHLFAVRFYAETRDLVSLSEILGHSNINTTRIYTRITRTKLREKIDAIQLFEPYYHNEKEKTPHNMHYDVRV